MRLLNIDTLQLETFLGSSRPRYAILSHTWGGEEILYEDVQQGKEHLLTCGKSALDKVLGSCKTARAHGLWYIWIDTCCIDKSSSAELSEAINSMFKWYEKAAVCFAYLEDLDADHEGALLGNLKACRWFSRGWTLQELLAPARVKLYNSEWQFVGDRRSLAELIAAITGIDQRALAKHQLPCRRDGNLDDGNCAACLVPSEIRDVLALFSVSTRMSWASKRITTREEDIAYSLMGIFDVNMPLLYGEGGEKAFRRLQEEIVRLSEDQSILLWKPPSTGERMALFVQLPVFAPHPSCFVDHFQTNWSHRRRNSRMSFSNEGLEVEAFLAEASIEWGRYLRREVSLWLAVLDCSFSGDILSSAAIVLEKADLEDPADQVFARIAFNYLGGWGDPFDECWVVQVGPDKARDSYDLDSFSLEVDLGSLRKQRIVLRTKPAAQLKPLRVFLGTSLPPEKHGFQLTASFPPLQGSSTDLSPYRGVHGGGASQLLCFSSCQSGFFVVRGVEYSFSERQLYDQPIFCHILSWESVLGSAYSSEHLFLVSDLNWLAQAALRICDESWKNWAGYERGSSSKNLNGLAISATIKSVEFLSRKAFQLDVTISQGE